VQGLKWLAPELPRHTKTPASHFLTRTFNSVEGTNAHANLQTASDHQMGNAHMADYALTAELHSAPCVPKALSAWTTR
jgi:hypothetical protein